MTDKTSGKKGILIRGHSFIDILYNYKLIYSYKYYLSDMKNTISYYDITVENAISLNKKDMDKPISLKKIYREEKEKNHDLSLMMLIQILFKIIYYKYPYNGEEIILARTYNYKSYIKDYLWCFRKAGIKNLKDYNTFLFMCGLAYSSPMNSSDSRSYFSFSTQSDKTTVKDFLHFLKESSELEYFKFGDVILLHEHAMKIEMETKEDKSMELGIENNKYVDNGTVNWIDSNNTKNGVYKIIPFDKEMEFFYFSAAPNATGFVGKIEPLPYLFAPDITPPHDIKDPLIVEFVESYADGYLEEYILEHFKKQFRLDCLSLLENVYVVKCCADAEQLIEGMFVPIYHFIFGFNKHLNIAEGFFMEDFCR